MLHSNQVAYEAARSIFEAARDFELTVRQTKIEVGVERLEATARPKLADDTEIPGFETAWSVLFPSTEWLPTLILHCSWNTGPGSGAGSVDLELRLAVWHTPGPYQGDLALQVATRPSNRQLLWINLTRRIANARDAKISNCVIPANFSLWTRTGERDARVLTQALAKDAIDAGFARLSVKEFGIFSVDTTTGEIEPNAATVFSRLVSAALIKLPYVTRGERSDIQGRPPFVIASVIRGQSITALHGDTETPLEDTSTSSVAESSPENVHFTFLKCSRFGPFDDFEWKNIARINVIVGPNDTGKSHLLKLMYALARGVEGFTARLDADKPSWAKVLAEKLVWTFEPHEGRLGQLVRRGATATVVHATLCNEDYPFSFDATAGAEATDFADVSKDIRPQPNLHALFMPPKEVLTFLNAITLVRGRRAFGFDDTYADLAEALRLDPVQDLLPLEFQRVLDETKKLLDGRIITEQGRFFFERNGERFGMTHTAEGIKKIGILTRLIENVELRRNSILFIDEPENNLHPNAARKFVQMLFELSRAGVQIFAATHSYFVLKQFEILARKHHEPVTLCSLDRISGTITATFADLQTGMPNTKITDESLSLYDEDVATSMNEGT